MRDRFAGKMTLSCIALFFILLGASSAQAYDRQSDELRMMGRKFGRGLINVSTGWIELVKGPYVGCKNEDAARGVFFGVIKGVGSTVTRTLIGVSEVVTCWLPYPGDYGPYLDPDIVFYEW